mgnify:CR=1 FL=1
MAAAPVAEPAAKVSRGDLVTLIGEGIGVDDLAERAGTIGYEVLTSLGARYRRAYKAGEVLPSAVASEAPSA